MANPLLSDKCANAVQQCAALPLREEPRRVAKRISFAGIGDLRLLSMVKLFGKIWRRMMFEDIRTWFYEIL
jgi:hypothetical protein